MRILQVITDTDRRGAQLFAMDVGLELSRRGHSVINVALRPGRRVPALEVTTLGGRSRGVATLWRLRRLMRSADVTIAHGSSTLSACSLAGLGLRQPFVYRQISDSRFWAHTRIRRARVRAYMRSARMIVALSAEARETLVSYIGASASKIVVIPNGVSAEIFHPAVPAETRDARVTLGMPVDAMVAVYVGALVPEKGVEIAIAAVARLPEVHLLVAGGGPDGGRLRALAHQLGADNVHFAGDLDAPWLAYAAGDMSILPSLGGDSMPASLIEAAFCGLPNVSTDVGSIGEIIEDEHTGLLVEIGDVDALRDAVNRLAEDVSLRQSLGTRARQRCLERYEIRVVGNSWERTCIDAIGEPTA